MTEVLWAAVGFSLAAVLAVGVLVRYQDLVLRSFRESEREHREQVVGLTDKLAVRTAAPGAEVAAQVRLARPAGPSRELSDEDYRKAHRSVQPMGL